MSALHLTLYLLSLALCTLNAVLLGKGLYGGMMGILEAMG